jgi:hypothetical protein
MEKIGPFERKVINAVKTKTELSSVMKLLWNMSELNDCDACPELTQSEMQSLGLDYDSEIASLLGLYKYVLNK